MLELVGSECEVIKMNGFGGEMRGWNGRSRDYERDGLGKGFWVVMGSI